MKRISRIRLAHSPSLRKKAWAILVKHSARKGSIASLAVYIISELVQNIEFKVVKSCRIASSYVFF